MRQLIQLELVEGGGGQPANECADRAREDAAGRLVNRFLDLYLEGGGHWRRRLRRRDAEGVVSSELSLRPEWSLVDDSGRSRHSERHYLHVK